MDMLPGPPGNYLSAADRGFLRHWGLCAACGRRGRKILRNATFSCIHDSSNIDAQCREGLLRFLLSLSDQQLVMALAMTIAALTQRCDISVYEFNVVTGLVYLSSLTHIATLIVLRHYFRQNRAVRNVRVCAMLANIVLLLFLTLESAAAEEIDISAPVQCVLQAPWMLNAQFKLSWWTVLPNVIIIVWQYIVAVSLLYLQEGEDLLDRLLSYLLRFYCRHPDTGKMLSGVEFENWHTEYVVQSVNRPGSANEIENLLARISLLGEDKPLRRRTRLTLVYLWREFDNAFLCELPTLLFNASYSSTQLVLSRINKPSIKGSQNTLDFGQVMPLLLLTIPVLTILETYYGRSNFLLFLYIY
jgi:hypothetical protein